MEGWANHAEIVNFRGVTMSAITRDQAVERLTREIKALEPYDLAETYNELFPSRPTTEAAARQNGNQILGQIMQHIDRGLLPEQIESLWNLLLSKECWVYYNEETDALHSNDELEGVW
jgi:hypothetical protein